MMLLLRSASGRQLLDGKCGLRVARRSPGLLPRRGSDVKVMSSGLRLLSPEGMSSGLLNQSYIIGVSCS